MAGLRGDLNISLSHLAGFLVELRWVATCNWLDGKGVSHCQCHRLKYIFKFAIFPIQKLLLELEYA